MSISLNELACHYPVSLLLRHGERPEIPAGTLGHEIGLTAHGKAACRKWGKQHGSMIRTVYTSPVPRCVETARTIANYSKKKEIYYKNILGDPGIFVIDCDLVHDYFLNNSPRIIVKKLLSPEINPPGFIASTAMGVQQLITWINDIAQENGLHLFITHDNILTIVLGFLFPQMNIDELWPHYLESLIIVKRKYDLLFLFRQHHRIKYEYQL